MKIKEIQKKGENLYTVTFEKRTLFGKKEIVRDVFNWYGYVKYADDNSYSRMDETIRVLIQNLNGFQPLKVN